MKYVDKNNPKSKKNASILYQQWKWLVYLQVVLQH